MHFMDWNTPCIQKIILPYIVSILSRIIFYSIFAADKVSLNTIIFHETGTKTKKVKYLFTTHVRVKNGQSDIFSIEYAYDISYLMFLSLCIAHGKIRYLFSLIHSSDLSDNLRATFSQIIRKLLPKMLGVFTDSKK